MNLLVNLSFENWLAIISLSFVAIGGIFIYLQWQKSLKTRRAEFINQILEKLRFDEDLTKTMYTIEYKHDWYNRDFHNSNFEPTIDKLLSYVDYLCYLKSTRNITTTEFKIFQYEIHRICVSSSSKVYLWNLYHFSVKNSTTCSFQNLINYGVKSRLFPKDFKENKSLYTKILNWD